MLLELRIENFAIIDELNLEPVVNPVNINGVSTSQGYILVRQDIYGNATGVTQVCDDQPNSCEVAYNSHAATCTQICQAGGGQCTAVFNNQGPCGHGQPAECGTTQFSSAICVCSK